MSAPLISIVVSNRDHAPFVGEAVASALSQEHSSVEVIVVDDGSTDGSQEVLHGFGSDVTTLFLEHRGQAAALNAGVERSEGAIVCILDSDDVFLSEKTGAVAEAMSAVERPLLLCHPLAPIDVDGTRLEGREPPDSREGWAGNLYDFAKRHRYLPFAGPPASGLVLNRQLVTELFPLRVADGVWHGADDLIVRGASLVAETRWLDRDLALYRRHGTYTTGHGRPRSREFHANQDAYLNDLLVRSGREPVIDFFSSEYARAFYLRSGERGALPSLALKVARRDPGPRTLAFAARTLLSAVLRSAAPRIERGP